MYNKYDKFKISERFNLFITNVQYIRQAISVFNPSLYVKKIEEKLEHLEELFYYELHKHKIAFFLDFLERQKRTEWQVLNMQERDNKVIDEIKAAFVEEMKNEKNK